MRYWIKVSLVENKKKEKLNKRNTNDNANKTEPMVGKVPDSGRATIVARGNAMVVVRYYTDANGRKHQQWQVIKK